jgi:phage terminase large subunit-like protein
LNYSPERLEQEPWLHRLIDTPSFLQPHRNTEREALAQRDWELEQLGATKLMAEYWDIYNETPDIAAKILERMPRDVQAQVERIPFNPIFLYSPFSTDGELLTDGNHKSSPILFHQDDSPIKVVVTGNRCSKTYSGAAEVICDCLGIGPVTKLPVKPFKPQPWWVVSDTEEASKAICQATYYDLIPQDYLTDYAEYTVEKGWKGNRIPFKNGSQIEFRFSSQGRNTFQGTYRNIHLDEEPPKEIYQECYARTTPVGGRPRGKILITFTPIYNPKVGISWIQTDLYAKRHQMSGITFHFWTLYDVPEWIIPNTEKEDIILGYEEDERDVRVLGLFTPVGMQLAFPRSLIAEQRQRGIDPVFYDIEERTRYKSVPVEEVKFLPEGTTRPVTTESEDYYDAIPVDEDIIRIFKHPEKGSRYAIGADPAQGLEHGDDSCIHVIDCDTFETVAEVQCKLDPDEFGDCLERLGYYYNTAYIGVENVADLTPIYFLNNADYPNLHYQCVLDGRVYDRTTDKIGWNTSTRTRRILRNDALQLLRNGDAKILSHALLDQMEIFARNPKGRWEAIAGGHDDLVFSWMIALQMVQCANIVDDWREDGLLPKLYRHEAEAIKEVTQNLPTAIKDAPEVGSNEDRLERFLDKKLNPPQHQEIPE